VGKVELAGVGDVVGAAQALERPAQPHRLDKRGAGCVVARGERPVARESAGGVPAAGRAAPTSGARRGAVVRDPSKGLQKVVFWRIEPTKANV
jgi:hypothetical protein